MIRTDSKVNDAVITIITIWNFRVFVSKAECRQK